MKFLDFLEIGFLHKKDAYKNAMTMELKLFGIDHRSFSYPVYYKDHIVDKVDLPIVLENEETVDFFLSQR